MSRGLLCGTATAMALAVTGCGSAGTKSEADVANVPRSETARAEGRLSSTPRALRLADLRREPEGSPQSTVLRLLYFAQWGSAPNVASAYHPTVRKELGVSNIVGTYSQQRTALATSRPRIVENIRTSTGAFVSIELLRADAAPAPHSFALQRRFGHWRIVYDTLLEGSLANYVASARSRNAAGKPPDRLAARQGREAAETYRGLFAFTLDR